MNEPAPGGERNEILSFPWPYRRIATEEAFSLPEVYEAMRGWAATADPAEPDQDFWDFVCTQDGPGLHRVRRQLLDVEHERLEIMDANGVDVQLLSLTAPGVQTFPAAEGTALARLANDRLAELIGKHPGRFAGLASVAPQDPMAAAAEIGRAVTELKLNGVIINSHTGSEYLDEQKYWPLLEAAEALGAPIYLHPRSPAAPMAAAFKKYGLETGIWGFQADAGLHGLRLICGGVFDRFPRLRIVAGHLGEALPFWLYRLDYMHAATVKARRYESMKPIVRKPSEYLRSNVWVTTSGMAWAPAIMFCRDVLGADRVMYAMDYPYEYTPEEVTAQDALPVGAAAKKAFFQGIAEQVFSLA